MCAWSVKYVCRFLWVLLPPPIFFFHFVSSHRHGWSLFSGFTVTKLVSPTNSNSLFIQEENDDPLESDPFQINIVCEDDGAGGKTWECHSCTKSFTLRCNLLAHMKQHLGNTGCSFCGKVLSTVGNLKKHLRNAHGVGASNSTPTHPEASYQYQQQ